MSWEQVEAGLHRRHGQPAQLLTIAVRDLPGLLHEIAKAKRYFGLPEDPGVVSCYEAGRDGFWLNRPS